MRWRFIDPNDPEAAERDAVIARIDSWWHEFRGKAPEIQALLSREAAWDLPGWMDRHLQAIHPNLMWEFGPPVRGKGHRLVITPESMHHLRPLVRTILGRAPAIDGWEFYEYRLPESLEGARPAIEARAGREIADFKVRVARGEHQRIDLSFASPTFAGPNDPSALQAAFVTAETLLGERCLNDWIGSIEVIRAPRKWGLGTLFGRGKEEELPHFLGLDRLGETVDALIGSVRDQLPPDPHRAWIEKARWTVYQSEPEAADDYFARRDMLAAKSANHALWMAADSGVMFSSGRFSRCGETFCYAKLDGLATLDEGGLAERHGIEEALDSALKPDGLGCQFGGGMGLRYAYIDLALTDVDRGIQAARRQLREKHVHKRSWILFFDSDLAAEWVGVYDDTPPPMAPDLQRAARA